MSDGRSRVWARWAAAQRRAGHQQRGFVGPFSQRHLARLAIDRQGATARLEAASGFLDTKKELFELKEGVRVQSDHGREVRLLSASVDFRAGTVVSNEAVTVTFENGTIEAGGVEVSDNGRVLHFKGRVRTTFSGPLAEESLVPPPARTSQADTGSLR